MTVKKIIGESLKIKSKLKGEELNKKGQSAGQLFEKVRDKP
jgi:hypothetical protein